MGVQQVGLHAFRDCAKLETVLFDGADVVVDYGAFTGCPLLDEESQRYIDEHLFTKEMEAKLVTIQRDFCPKQSSYSLFFLIVVQ